MTIKLILNVYGSVLFSFFSHLLQSDHSRLSSECSRSVEFPGSSSNGLLATIAFPDTNTSPLHTYFPAEWACIS